MTTSANNELRTEILKALAIMEHEGDDYFIIDNVAYVGSEEDARESYSEDKDCTQAFEEWIIDNGEEVAEYEENDNPRYLVYDDSEADRANSIYADNYFDEFIEPTLPNGLSYYFDEKKWKECEMSDRGANLAGYNGDEIEVNIEGETFYLYQQR